ncbi:carboxymuconolactone decarboxylase family protein [bacterium]|nr:MAG: carboxymuconolactone decarboxylase family protein [bacterium]
MSIFKLVEESAASSKVQETYEKIKARYGGMIPAVYKAFANDPEYLASLNDHIARVMAPRRIDTKTKEVIAFVVAAMNGCDFCSHAHAAGLRRFGYDDEAIAEILGTTALWSEVTRFNIGARVSWPKDVE